MKIIHAKVRRNDANVSIRKWPGTRKCIAGFICICSLGEHALVAFMHSVWSEQRKKHWERKKPKRMQFNCFISCNALADSSFVCSHARCRSHVPRPNCGHPFLCNDWRKFVTLLFYLRWQHLWHSNHLTTAAFHFDFDILRHRRMANCKAQCTIENLSIEFRPFCRCREKSKSPHTLGQQSNQHAPNNKKKHACDRYVRVNDFFSRSPTLASLRFYVGSLFTDQLILSNLKSKCFNCDWQESHWNRCVRVCLFYSLFSGFVCCSLFAHRQ